MSFNEEENQATICIFHPIGAPIQDEQPNPSECNVHVLPQNRTCMCIMCAICLVSLKRAHTPCQFHFVFSWLVIPITDKDDLLFSLWNFFILGLLVIVSINTLHSIFILCVSLPCSATLFLFVFRNRKSCVQPCQNVQIKRFHQSRNKLSTYN